MRYSMMIGGINVVSHQIATVGKIMLLRLVVHNPCPAGINQKVASNCQLPIGKILVCKNGERWSRNDSQRYLIQRPQPLIFPIHHHVQAQLVGAIALVEVVHQRLGGKAQWHIAFAFPELVSPFVDGDKIVVELGVGMLAHGGVGEVHYRHSCSLGRLEYLAHKRLFHAVALAVFDACILAILHHDILRGIQERRLRTVVNRIVCFFAFKTTIHK